MSPRRSAAAVGALAVAPLALSLLTAAPAAAHGSMDDPISRVKLCREEGPEAPRSDACRDAVAIGGTQPLYDWNEVNIPNAAGAHRSLIPDGRLCGAGRDKYAGLDQARVDWPATAMNSGNHTFRYTATAPHPGGFELYITTPGWDPTQPLRWSDLELFGEVSAPPLVNGDYVFDATIPRREGRHLIYSIWQRTDSPEAFYTCSDVVFGADTTGAPVVERPAEPVDVTEGVDPTTVGDHPDHEHHHGPEEDYDALAAAERAGKELDKYDPNEATDAPEDSAQAPEDVAGDSGADAEEGARGADGGQPNAPTPHGGGDEVRLATTGSDPGTMAVAVGGAAALALGAGVLLVTARRRMSGRNSA
ncbi:chitin-binding protein [Streptomyces alkaliphilus]|uniref:Chitin-binding protein n=1 Tax=Streptomyces alkaliphilus TaxID=1472722 RepID=A0A7W3Y1X6_9ACTN|nr:lytic polysaccharide monooxygenase [Streptomyces alkaliphilus]MBB0245169.1 chitin-binding protein [Streptomyces alkaliphilus]